jgi:thiamine biosynthesis lipoprotein
MVRLKGDKLETRQFSSVWKKWTLLTLVIILGGSLLLSGCGQVEHQLNGRTMGTTYMVKVVAPRSAKMEPVQQKVDSMLEAINQSMSTYRKQSEISRFNRLTTTETDFPISAHFLRVMLTAREIYQLTSGAWDGTVHPLVNLWGFGKDGKLEKIPTDDQIEDARKRVGFDRIVVGVNGSLQKETADVSVNLASIAKGYGVDQVALVLRNHGFEHFLVEIGGEVYAAGQRPDGKPWQVGVNRPEAAAATNAIYQAVALENQALATSGDYRIFYEIQGQTYSHIIDPRTGRPVRNGVVSVSVLADNCTLSDGLATALMVMGADDGLALLNRLPGVEGLIVVRHPNGKLEDFPSQNWQGRTP